MPHRRLLSLLSLLLLLLAAPDLRAQEPERPGRATVIVHVIDRASATPLPGVLVEISALNRRGFTDSQGRVALVNIEFGEHPVLFRQLGFTEHTEVWTVDRDPMTFTVALGARPIVIEGVTAYGFQYSERLHQRRLAVGVSSRTVSRDLLRNAASSDAVQVLRYAGLERLQCNPQDLDRLCLLVRGRPVRPIVFIDEQPVVGGLMDLESYQPDELFLLEVYGGGRHIRAYTTRFIDTAGGRNLRPAPIIF